MGVRGEGGGEARRGGGWGQRGGQGGKKMRGPRTAMARNTRGVGGPGGSLWVRSPPRISAWAPRMTGTKTALCLVARARPKTAPVRSDQLTLVSPRQYA